MTTTKRLTELLKAAGPRRCSCDDPWCEQWHGGAGFPAYQIRSTSSAGRGTAGGAASLRPLPAPPAPLANHN